MQRPMSVAVLPCFAGMLFTVIFSFKSLVVFHSSNGRPTQQLRIHASAECAYRRHRCRFSHIIAYHDVGEARQGLSNHILSKCLLAHVKSAQHLLKAISQLLFSCTQLEDKNRAAIIDHLQPFLGFALLYKAPQGILTSFADLL